MKRENYRYYYFHNSDTLKSYQMAVPPGENKHVLSVADFSMGYERKLTQAISFRAEPYLKIPIAGVGEGKVKLISAGLQLGLKLQPLGRRSGGSR